VKEIKSSEGKDYRSCIELKLETDQGDLNAVGTIFGRENPKIVSLQGYELDFNPEGHILVCGTIDRPGIIGNIGTVLGKKGINIAHMTWARKNQAGDAIVVLSTDDNVDKATLEEIEKIDNVEWAQCLQL